MDALEEAGSAQTGAETAITNASGDIDATQIHLTQVDILVDYINLT